MSRWSRRTSRALNLCPAAVPSRSHLSPVAPLIFTPVGARGNVTTKVHRRRKEWESQAYPRASTEEPNNLPRRGRRGGWMRDPSIGVAKLDGTNSAQQAWWTDRESEVIRSLKTRVQEAEEGQKSSIDIQEQLDVHLAKLDALRVEMPAADDIRKPHIKRLANTPKVNPMHEATAAGPPLSAAPDSPAPSFVAESLDVRSQQRRGRFMGAARRVAAADQVPDEGAAALIPEIAEAADHVPRIAIADAEEELADLDGPSSPPPPRSGGRRSARIRAAADDEDLIMQEMQSAPEPMEPVRASYLGDIWAAHGASWAHFNNCVVPSAFPQSVEGAELVGATMESYSHTRQAASVFDLSFKVCFSITGIDREFVAGQFLTCNLTGMRVGDVQYACILDSKGLVLDDAFVYLTDHSVEILASGCHARQVTDYIGQYVVYVRRSGADVVFENSSRSVVLGLQGPRAREALKRALTQMRSADDHNRTGDVLRLTTALDSSLALSPQVLGAMPYMSFLNLHAVRGGDAIHESAAILCVGTTGEDGFEIIAEPGSLVEQILQTLLDDEPLVKPAGIHCLDVLRMEAGFPRVGADIRPGVVTPVRASLAWTLDQAKMRNHLMFGWQQIFVQLAKGPKFRRVGLIIDGPAHGGCRILSNPHRQPIGEITSTAWSPALQARVGMAYVKPEYAKANRNVLVTTPYNLPTHKMLKRAVKKWSKMGPLRAAYRRLVAACVAPLPLVPHRYPEPERQRKPEVRLRTFDPSGTSSADRKLSQKGQPLRRTSGPDASLAASASTRPMESRKHPLGTNTPSSPNSQSSFTDLKSL